MLEVLIQKDPKLVVALKSTRRSSTPKQVLFLKDPEMHSPLKARSMLPYKIPDSVWNLNAV